MTREALSDLVIVTIRLRARDVARARVVARQRAIRYQQVIRSWVANAAFPSKKGT